MIRLTFALAALSLLGTYGLQAQNSSRRLYGSGGDLCGTWVAARATANARGDSRITQAALFEEWLRGFVSGFGAATSSLKETDSKTMADFVDGYCRQHPTGRLYDAATAFVREWAARN